MTDDPQVYDCVRQREKTVFTENQNPDGIVQHNGRGNTSNLTKAIRIKALFFQNNRPTKPPQSYSSSQIPSAFLFSPFLFTIHLTSPASQSSPLPQVPASREPIEQWHPQPYDQNTPSTTLPSTTCTSPNNRTTPAPTTTPVRPFPL